MLRIPVNNFLPTKVLPNAVPTLPASFCLNGSNIKLDMAISPAILDLVIPISSMPSRESSIPRPLFIIESWSVAPCIKSLILLVIFFWNLTNGFQSPYSVSATPSLNLFLSVSLSCSEFLSFIRSGSDVFLITFSSCALMVSTPTLRISVCSLAVYNCWNCNSSDFLKYLSVTSLLKCLKDSELPSSFINILLVFAYCCVSTWVRIVSAACWRACISPIASVIAPAIAAACCCSLDSRASAVSSSPASLESIFFIHSSSLPPLGKKLLIILPVSLNSCLRGPIFFSTVSLTLLGNSNSPSIFHLTSYGSASLAKSPTALRSGALIILSTASLAPAVKSATTR